MHLICLGGERGEHDGYVLKDVKFTMAELIAWWRLDADDEEEEEYFDEQYKAIDIGEGCLMIQPEDSSYSYLMGENIDKALDQVMLYNYPDGSEHFSEEWRKEWLPKIRQELEDEVNEYLINPDDHQPSPGSLPNQD